MIDKYKLVCNTAAGRRRYMQYLIPQIVASEIVDRYDIWINTTDKQDIEFFKIIASKFPKINLVYQPDGIVNGIASINAFYKDCIEEDVIYFKLDDDIVWLEPNLFEKMAQFRIDNPEYFLVSPLVINNALSTYILQVKGKIDLDRYYNASSANPMTWGSGEFASQLHEWFLNNYLKTKKYEEIHCGVFQIAMNRFSINSILWFGSEMAKFDGIVPGDDEEWLSCIKPTQLGKANSVNANALVSHFAFYPQREMLDKRSILEQYGNYLHQEWMNDEKMAEIDKIIQDAMQEVEIHKDEIFARPAIYQPVMSRKKTFRQKLGAVKIPFIRMVKAGDIKTKISEKQLKQHILK